MPLQNKYEALELEGQGNDSEEGLSGGLPRASQSTPHITTRAVKKERRVIVGDSLLRELRALYADQTHPTGESAASLGPG